MADLKLRALGLDALFTQIGVGYLVLYLALIALVLWRAKGGATKAVWAGFITFLFALPVGFIALLANQSNTKATAQYSEYMAKYEPAKAIFDKLCAEQSQPIIKRVVEDVEGILLLKLRPELNQNDDTNQMWAGAGLPGELTGKAYIKAFLLDREIPKVPESRQPSQRQIAQKVAEVGERGFRYVDHVDANGDRLRYTAYVADAKLHMHPDRVKLKEEKSVRELPRFAVTFEDNLDPAYRKHWIAGTVVKVVDAKTAEVIGQQSFWNWDPGFGNTSGSRSPWRAGSKQCPIQPSVVMNTHNFVYQVLSAKRGN
jgi:hypothetical protein